MNDALVSRLANCRAMAAERLPAADQAAIDDAMAEIQALRAQLRTLALWIAEALTTLDTVEPECSTEAELLATLIRRGEMLVLAGLQRSKAT